MRIGIIGTGQLARMLAQAGQPMGISFAFLAEPGSDTSSVKGLGEIVAWNEQDSAQSVYAALGEPHVITVEKEDVDLNLLDGLTTFCTVAPNSKSIAVCQHRNKEKQFLTDLKLPTVDYFHAVDFESINAACESLNFNAIIKSCSMGYDGKNQWRVKSKEDILAHQDQLPHGDYVVEKWSTLDTEVSMIAARSSKGEMVFYPLTENTHENGILVTSRAYRESDLLHHTEKTQTYLKAIMESLDYVGVMAMECFIIEGEVIINELAPRVHNSGHWTQQGCETSQFENHLRAIIGKALGRTELLHDAAMLNLLGKKVETNEISEPNSTLHWYDKACKPGRKVGHINIVGKNHREVEESLNRLKAHVYQ